VLAKLGPMPQTRLTLVLGRDRATQARDAVAAAQAFRQTPQ
jgi:hypothetical protein